MSVEVNCPSCQTKLSVATNPAPARVKCPKCGSLIDVGAKKASMPAAPAAVAQARPPLARPVPAGNPLLYFFPACSILAALFSMAIPMLLGQYILGLIAACLAAIVSVAGLALLVLKKNSGGTIHLAGAAISAAAIVLAINGLVLQANIERNETLRTKNEQAASQAKADLDEAKKKLAAAEEAPRLAKQILKEAEEAPKKAELFFKMAKAVQDKADAAKKRTSELLAKAEELERKNDRDRQKVAEEKAKLQESLKALQNLDRIKKDIDDRKQELVALKKELDADKKKADEELAESKKAVEAERKKMEEREKEIKDLLKKVENAVQKAALNLKNKNPQIRLTTVKQLAKLPRVAELKAVVAEALVTAMLDPLPAIGESANEALEKVDPVIQPHVFTLLFGQDKTGAAAELAKLGNEGRAAVPALIYRHHVGLAKGEVGPRQGGNVAPHYLPYLAALTKISPTDTRIGQLVVFQVATPTPPKFGSVYWRRKQAMDLLEAVEVDRKEKIKALVIALNDPELAVDVIAAIEKIEPAATDAVPALKKLKLSSDDAVRQAAVNALAKIEKSK